jgi:hypothetical protein
MVLDVVVSFRSIPRFLALLRSQMPTGPHHWAPHFTSVINWRFRTGLGLLQQVGVCAEPWIAIIDYSIDIGTKKVLVVLRVALNVFDERRGALQLGDCECIGLSIAETVNGERVTENLTRIFDQAGPPAAVVKDLDATLNKGVRLWMQARTLTIPVIEDISGLQLKSEYRLWAFSCMLSTWFSIR